MKLLVDPEDEENDCCVTVGSMPALGQVTSLHLTGEADLDQACSVSWLRGCTDIR